MHVFAGLVQTTTSRYDAEQGRYEMSISSKSNMEWLHLSRYNQQPSLQQTDAIVYDPLTPFKFQTDPATGLPVGRPQLTETNQRILQSGKLYFPRGRLATRQVTREEDLRQDVKVIGGSLLPVFEMPPGFKYRWKEGIVTATYDMSTVDPLDKKDRKSVV